MLNTGSSVLSCLLLQNKCKLLYVIAFDMWMEHARSPRFFRLLDLVLKRFDGLLFCWLEKLSESDLGQIWNQKDPLTVSFATLV